MLQRVVEVVEVAGVIEGFNSEVGGDVSEGVIVFFMEIDAFIIIRIDLS